MQCENAGWPIVAVAKHTHSLSLGGAATRGNSRCDDDATVASTTVVREIRSVSFSSSCFCLIDSGGPRKLRVTVRRCRIFCVDECVLQSIHRFINRASSDSIERSLDQSINRQIVRSPVQMKLPKEVYLDPSAYSVISDNNLIFCRILELESALEDEGLLDQRRLRQICKLTIIPEHLRPQVWKVSAGSLNDITRSVCAFNCVIFSSFALFH